MPRKKKSQEVHKMMRPESPYAHCGYEILPDGKIRVASMLCDIIDDVHNEIDALDHLMKSVSDYYAGRMKPLMKKRQDFWSGMRAGIPEMGRDWLYDTQTRTVYPKPKEENEVQD